MDARWVGALAGICLGIGCRVFDGALVEEDAGARDGGRLDSGDVDGGASDAGPSCTLRRPPPRPEGADDGEDVGELIFVFHHLSIMLEGDEWRTIGWDLDGLCSEPPEPVVECYARASSAVPEIDGEGGIDNALGHNLLPLFLSAFPEIGTTLGGPNWGHGSLIVRVRGWNGGDDDPLVDVAFTQSVVGTPALPDGGMPSIDVEDIRDEVYPNRPRWDGNDWFWARNATFFEGDPEQPRIHVDDAYVAGRVLVIDFPDRIPIVFNDRYGAFVVQFTDGHLAGRITDDMSGFDWGVFGGRWPVSDLLSTLPLAGFCVGSDEYATVERIMDLTADVRAAPGSGGPDTVCDAISGGLTGLVSRGHLAGLIDTHDELVDACADAGLTDGGVPDAASD